MNDGKIPSGKSRIEELAELEAKRLEIVARIEAERSQALEEIIERAESDAVRIGSGIETLIQRLVERRDSRRGRTTASHEPGKRAAPAIKYRNPANTSETWTGRGKRPRWLTAAIDAGASLESFSVDADKQTSLPGLDQKAAA